jgi:hypothetical protein
MPSTNSSRDVRSRQPQRLSFDKSRQKRKLEELRKRRLTPLLNRHFTEAVRRVALEKAAADAAQMNLERRKAQASLSARPKKSVEVEVSASDVLCLKVDNWQKETRQKERETFLLYQRYVDTFGRAGTSNGQVPHGNETKEVLLQSAHLSHVFDEDGCSNSYLSQETTAKCILQRTGTRIDGEVDKKSESCLDGVNSPQNHSPVNGSNSIERQDVLNKTTYYLFAQE